MLNRIKKILEDRCEGLFQVFMAGCYSVYEKQPFRIMQAMEDLVQPQTFDSYYQIL